MHFSILLWWYISIIYWAFIILWYMLIFVLYQATISKMLLLHIFHISFSYIFIFLSFHLLNSWCALITTYLFFVLAYPSKPPILWLLFYYSRHWQLIFRQNKAWYILSSNFWAYFSIFFRKLCLRLYAVSSLMPLLFNTARHPQLCHAPIFPSHASMPHFIIGYFFVIPTSTGSSPGQLPSLSYRLYLRLMSYIFSDNIYYYI